MEDSEKRYERKSFLCVIVKFFICNIYPTGKKVYLSFLETDCNLLNEALKSIEKMPQSTYDEIIEKYVE